MSSSFPVLRNDLLLRAAKGQKIERAPVWAMRQAGRYLPEFRQIRRQHDFFTLCRTPELAAEVTLQPIFRFEGLVDAAIIFSDILVVPQAMGMQVEMREGIGPVFPSPLENERDVEALLTSNLMQRLQYVFDALTLTRHKLEGRVPLIGFVGAPWTLMSYMVEGGGSRTQSKAKKWLYKKPHLSHRLLGMITDVLVDFLVYQVKSGAQMLQIFESHAEHLGPELFENFALPYLKRIALEVKTRLADQAVPMTVFAKGGHYALESLSELPYDVIGLDWTMNGAEVRSKLKNKKVVLQGNLDPCALYASEQDLRGFVQKMCENMGENGNFIANLGHGVYPDAEPEAMKNFFQAVHDFSKK